MSMASAPLTNSRKKRKDLAISDEPRRTFDKLVIILQHFFSLFVSGL